MRQVERDPRDGAQVGLTSLAPHIGMARQKADAGVPDLAVLRYLNT